MKDITIKEYIRFKIHGGKIEDLDPELQKILAKPTQNTSVKRIKEPEQ